jgi:hypothetical protein
MLGTVKATARRILGETPTGFIDYCCFPGRRAAWGGPSNGQARKREVFHGLMAFHYMTLIETGTFLGSTREYFAGTGLPVFSIATLAPAAVA